MAPNVASRLRRARPWIFAISRSSDRPSRTGGTVPAKAGGGCIEDDTRAGGGGSERADGGTVRRRLGGGGVLRRGSAEGTDGSEDGDLRFAGGDGSTGGGGATIMGGGEGRTMSDSGTTGA